MIKSCNPVIGPQQLIYVLEATVVPTCFYIVMLSSHFLCPILSLSPEPPVRDYGKENVRRMREIQRRFREQEAQKDHLKPVPVKALWTSPKYQDIPSRVMAQLQVSVLSLCTVLMFICVYVPDVSLCRCLQRRRVPQRGQNARTS